MVWYNPFTWGKDENAAAAAPMETTPVAPPAASEYPSTPAYGGRKRKHRKTHRGGKKHRSKTGRRKQH